MKIPIIAPLLMCTMFVSSFAMMTYSVSTVVGDSSKIYSPCSSTVTSLSRLTERELAPIWRTGSMIDTTQTRISLSGHILSINPVVDEDAGEYIWVCSNGPYSMSIKLIITVAPTSTGPLKSVIFGCVAIFIGPLICCLVAVKIRRKRRRGERLARLNTTNEIDPRDRIFFTPDHFKTELPTYQEALRSIGEAAPPPYTSIV